jgi:5-methylcytosine-specific restriction endonuclease McrA
MRVIDQETGKPYHLDRTPDLDADLDAFYASQCHHETVEIRQRKDGGGASHFYRQCTNCGTSVGSALKKSAELLNAPPWHPDHEDQYNVAREAERLAIYQKHIRKQRNREDGFQRKYDIYLKSPEWRARRDKVFRRSEGICEGCLDAKATQVHHLNYDNIGNEFMFELVAICEPCHRRLHADKPDIDEDEDLEAIAAEWEAHYPCDGCRHSSELNNRRWCFIADVSADIALATGGDCGPNRDSFEPLR